MAATAPTDEVIYFYSCGEPYTDNDTPSTTLYAFIYSRARHVVFPIGQLPLPGGGEATTLQFDGTGKMLYASVSNGDYSPASFAIDAKGMPTLTDKVPMVNPLQFGLAVDPTQKYVYTGSAEFFNPEVRGYSVSQGVFSPLKGVADHTKSMVSVMTMSLDGKYLFLSTTASPFTGIGKNTVVSYAVNPLTGVLTPINEQADGREVLAIAVTPDGKYLYAASAREDTIYRYGIDQGALSTGTLVANAGMEIDGFVLVSEP
ncbi:MULTISPECIES: beta-propeller fold lactonase family protein [Pandoraea]|nr:MULTISPECIES: beta-propeller fold lactonase family protein [Pandoraea]